MGKKISSGEKNIDEKKRDGTRTVQPMDSWECSGESTAVNINHQNIEVMKRVMLTLIALVCILIGAQAQTSYKVEGNTYKSVSSSTRTSAEPINTGYNWQDSKGNNYPILMSAGTGSCFVIRVSSKTGNEYRNYLGPEISSDICKKLGREYKGKTTTTK